MSWIIAIAVVLLAIAAWAEWTRRRRGLHGPVDASRNPREVTDLGEPGAETTSYGDTDKS